MQLDNFILRPLAFVIDLVIVYLFIYIVLLTVTGICFDCGLLVMRRGGIFGFLVFQIYLAASYSHLLKGQSIGKRLFKYRVIRFDKTHLSYFQSFLRAFVVNIQVSFAVLFWPLTEYWGTWAWVVWCGLILGLCVSEVFYFFATKGQQSLHDLLFKSWVVDAIAPQLVKFEKKKVAWLSLAVSLVSMLICFWMLRKHLVIT